MFQVIMLPGNEGFNQSLRNYLELQNPGKQKFIDIDSRFFANGEAYARIKKNVRRGEVFLVSSGGATWGDSSEVFKRLSGVMEAWGVLSSVPSEDIKRAGSLLLQGLTGLELTKHPTHDDLQRALSIFISKQAHHSVNDELMRMLVALDALKRTGARDIQVVMPGMPYLRQDRKDKPRVPISAKMLADLIEKVGGKSLSNVITVDMHAPQEQGFFDGPVDNLYTTYMIAADIQATLQLNGIASKDIILISPDLGGEKRIKAIAKILECHIGVFDKERGVWQETEQSLLVPHGGRLSLKNKTAIAVDDIIDSANSLNTPCEWLKTHGIKKTMAYVTHGVLTELAPHMLHKKIIDRLVVFNTIALPPYMMPFLEQGILEQLDIAPLVGESILANAGVGEGSVSALFDLTETREICHRGGIKFGRVFTPALG